MCVAVPFKIQSIHGCKAVVESLGVLTEADISLVETVNPGDYVLVHAGFAIAKVEAVEAEETLEAFRVLDGGDPV